MLAVADALEARGAAVRMAGGGAGSQFVALNGYDALERYAHPGSPGTDGCTERTNDGRAAA
jgi:hypothetical protein